MFHADWDTLTRIITNGDQAPNQDFFENAQPKLLSVSKTGLQLFETKWQGPRVPILFVASCLMSLIQDFLQAFQDRLHDKSSKVIYK